jgi:hypothetical protein
MLVLPTLGMSSIWKQLPVVLLGCVKVRQILVLHAAVDMTLIAMVVLRIFNWLVQFLQSVCSRKGLFCRFYF